MVKKKLILNDTSDNYNLNTSNNEIDLEKELNSGILYCGKVT